MGVHDGHRQRLRSQFEKHGLDVMDDVNVLELLLFYAQPRKDTNITAHMLLKKFGTLQNVFSAPVGLLEEVPGVGHSTAVYIHLINEVSRRKNLIPINNSVKIMKSEEAVKYLAPLFEGATEEMLYLLMLDKNYRAIDCMLLSKGVSNKVMTDAGRITLELLSKRAAAAIMAHNHPVGLPTPSSGDVSATKIIESSLTKLGIVFMDHLIFSTNRCYSMRKNNFISPSEW